MIRKYKYEMTGTGANDATWKTTGEAETATADIFSVFNHALRDSFNQLTQGKAEYGNPGKGCAGPYEILTFKLDKVVDHGG